MDDKEKPDLIFGPHPDYRKYFRENALIPLSYYNDPKTGEAVERSPEVMRAMWDAYYESIKPDRR